jgi:hypothetical protein
METTSTMLVTFGKKHQGKTVESLILKEPDYIKWVLEQPNPTGGLARVKAEALRLIGIFDQKPIMGPCNGHGCKQPPVRFSAYAGNSEALYQWCDSCNPYEAGAVSGKLAEIKTYRDALRHVEWTDGGVKSGYKAIVKAMALRKGLPKRSGDAQVKAFFATA